MWKFREYDRIYKLRAAIKGNKYLHSSPTRVENDKNNEDDDSDN